MVNKLKSRIIAFYLPQFHPIQENNAWWGEGFTEWTNVRNARPLFPGHKQPRQPGTLGYYDLRSADVRAAQAELAVRHGIEGFCYWHYWFGGKRLLEKPFEAVLRSGTPSLPFCLGWANESWTGIWHGAPNKILMEQTYPGEEDDRQHFDYLLAAFSDPRYIRVEGKPLLVIYKPLLLPQAKARFELWRNMATSAGLPGLHIVGFNMDDFNDTRPLGLDAVVVYRLGQTQRSAIGRRLERIYWGVRRRLPGATLRKIPYELAIAHHVPEVDELDYLAYPCVVPNWDNTPRSGKRGMVLTGSTPQKFGDHLRRAIDVLRHRSPQHRIIFLKAWNEWAEGNYVEPDTEFGTGYLAAIREENTVPFPETQ